MKANSLTPLLLPVAKSFGYEHRSGLFWKARGTLTQLLHLQGSRWNRGVYVNCGVTPRAFVTQRTPPGTGYWGLEIRPTAWEGPYFGLFRDWEDGRGEVTEPGQVEAPLRWLLDWMELHFEPEKVRQDVLSATSWCAEAGIVSRLIVDWANGSLEPPSRYFPGTRYYA